MSNNYQSNLKCIILINLLFFLNFASQLCMSYASVDATKDNLSMSFICFDENLSNK